MAHWYQPGLKRGALPLKVWRDWVGEEMPRIRVNLAGNNEYQEEVYVDAAKLGEVMICNYLDKYGKDPTWDVIQTERPFEVIIANGRGDGKVLFCGTYDGVYRDLANNDALMLMEHKTAKAISTGHLSMDDQAGGYFMVAARELANAKLIGAKERLRGIMYNFARKSPGDDRPRNADGVCTNKPTKADYVAQLNMPATLPLPKLAAIAAKRGVTVFGEVSKNQPAPLFVRHSVMRTTRERNNMVKRIQAEVEHMNAVRSGELSPYKITTRTCEWDCSMYHMCLLHESGGPDWEEYRDAMMTTQDKYAAHRKSAWEESGL